MDTRDMSPLTQTRYWIQTRRPDAAWYDLRWFASSTTAVAWCALWPPAQQQQTRIDYREYYWNGQAWQEALPLAG